MEMGSALRQWARDRVRDALAAGGLCFATLPPGARISLGRPGDVDRTALAWRVASLELVGLSRHNLADWCDYGIRRRGGCARAPLRLRSLCFVWRRAGWLRWYGGWRSRSRRADSNPGWPDYRLTGSMHSNILAVQAAVVAIVATPLRLQPGKRVAFCWAVFTAAWPSYCLTRARTALATVVAASWRSHVVGRPARQWMFWLGLGNGGWLSC